MHLLLYKGYLWTLYCKHCAFVKHVSHDTMSNQQNKKRFHVSESSDSDSSFSITANSPINKQLPKRQKPLMNESNNMPVEGTHNNTNMADQDQIADLIQKGITQALKNPEIINLITESATSKLNAEIKKLTVALDESNKKVKELEGKVDELEMYGRRNGIRLHGIQQQQGEDTDNIVMTIARKIGANIPEHGLGRSHRIKRMPGSKQTGPPPIIAKFISHNLKVEMLRHKGGLDSLNINDLPPGSTPIYMNEDLTRQRSGWAKRARDLKKAKKCLSTWTRDGVIFLKFSDSQVLRANSDNELTEHEQSLRVIPEHLIEQYNARRTIRQ